MPESGADGVHSVQPEIDQFPSQTANGSWFLGALLTAAKTAKWAVLAWLGFAVVLCSWAISNRRTPHGGWDAFFTRSVWAVIGCAAWGAGVGFFSHQLPHQVPERFGRTHRSVMLLLCGVAGGLIPVIIIELFFGAENQVTSDVGLVGIFGAAIGVIVGFARQLDNGLQMCEGKYWDDRIVDIKYSAPSVRGRKMFGEGGRISHDPTYPVWRAGANGATSLHTGADLDIKGLSVPKGDYTIFVLVNQDPWQLIINRQTGQWGLIYDAKRDLGRVPMDMAKPDALIETFKITLTKTGDNTGELQLAFENYVASVPFTLK